MNCPMFRLHLAPFAIVAAACFACAVPVPQPPRLTIDLGAKGQAQVKTPPKVELRAEVVVPEVAVDVAVGVEAGVEAAVEVDANAEVVVEPVEYTAPVALEGSAVVEFFGIPLDGAQDVVFVLDRSGSMENFALGQIAQLAAPNPVDAQPPLDAPPPPDDQVPLDALPPDAPPPPPNAPPPPPDAPPPPEAQQTMDASAPVTSPVIQPAEPTPQVYRPRKIDVAHAELVDALERLPVGTRMNLLFFNNRLEALHATIAPLDESNRQDMITFVRETFPDGMTALAPAMRTAFLLKAKRIILLSDGLGNLGGDAGSVLRDAREAMRGGVRIDTIGLGQDQDVWLLRTLAEESGGFYQQL